MQHPDGVHHLIGIKSGVLVVRVAVTNPERKGLRLAFGEMKTAAALKDEEATVPFGLRALAIWTFFLGGQQHRGTGWAFREGIVPFNEAAGAANHE